MSLAHRLRHLLDKRNHRPADSRSDVDAFIAERQPSDLSDAELDEIAAKALSGIDQVEAERSATALRSGWKEQLSDRARHSP